MKVLIIGLDGATWTVFNDFVLDQFMPNLRRLKTQGSSGILKSTVPPITPAAWTTCITGCHPYTHGVVGFRDFCFKTNALHVSTAASCRVPNLFETLSGQGFKVAAINVPWTYPCRKVNGIIVAGYGIPGVDSQFTYPVDFRDELLQAIPDYRVLADWQNENDDQPEVFDANIARVERCFEQRVEAAAFVNDKIKPDVLMVEIQNVDMLQHRIWAFIDSQSRDQYPFQRDRIYKMFRKLDAVIGRLMELADKTDAHVLLVSDHGFCGMKGTVRPNVLLHQWGYLKIQSPLQRAFRRVRRNLDSFFHKRLDNAGIEFKTPVNWRHSKAMMVYPAMYGFIYLNVKDRIPNDRVNANSGYGEMLNDLKSRFQSVLDPKSQKPIFDTVATPEEFFGKDDLDPEITGDLLLIPRQGYILHQTTSIRKPPVEATGSDDISGCHSPDGVFLVNGAAIKQNYCIQSHIVNITPTVYALLEVPIPGHLDGQYIEDIFTQKPNVICRTVEEASEKTRQKADLTDSEEDEVIRRLADLGYMD